jgi:hypothetical protein
MRVRFELTPQEWDQNVTDALIWRLRPTRPSHPQQQTTQISTTYAIAYRQDKGHRDLFNSTQKATFLICTLKC